MVNDLGEGIAPFLALTEKANSSTKELNTTNINRKGVATNRKTGLPLYTLFLKTTIIWMSPSFFAVSPPSFVYSKYARQFVSIYHCSLID